MNRTETIHSTLSPITHRGTYDIRHIIIDKSLPPAERIQNYLIAVSDPYHFSVGDMNVTIRFKGDKNLPDCLSDTIKAMVCYTNFK